MSEDWSSEFKCLIYHELPGCIGQMLFTADNVCNLHQRIVNDNLKIVRWNSVRFYNHEIADVIPRKLYMAAYHIVKCELGSLWNCKAIIRNNSRTFLFCTLFLCKVATFAAVPCHFTFLQGFLAFYRKLFRRAIAWIRHALINQFL